MKKVVKKTIPCTKPACPIAAGPTVAQPAPAGEFHVEMNRADHESPPLTECLDWLRTGCKVIYHVWCQPGPEFGKMTQNVQIGHVHIAGDDLFVCIRKGVELYRNLTKSLELEAQSDKPGAGGA